ncbi:MAG: helix-turn-helix domain-containing protein [Ruminococcaceae bacterium]|nr:helix-turn-helix domain-containing protein [Oscillospiraceae bacterium]
MYPCNNIIHHFSEYVNREFIFYRSPFVTNYYASIGTICYNKIKGLLHDCIKNIRKKRKLNQLKAAMDLNISHEALSYYENGKRGYFCFQNCINPLALQILTSRFENFVR